MAQGQVYDPLTKRTLTIEEAQQIMRERGGSMSGTGEGLDAAKIGIQNPLVEDQFVGFDLGSKAAAGKVGSEAMRASGQIAGMLAQFLPQGKALGASYKGAMTVPTLVDLVMQMIEKETLNPLEVDPVRSGVNAAAGGFSKAVGNTIARAKPAGESFIRKSLAVPDDMQNRAAETMLPKLVLQENAKMTREGVDAIADKAARTSAGGMQDLAEVMERARLKGEFEPLRLTLWPQEAGTNLARRPPRTMGLGKKLARVGQAAPAAELSTRALMALLASQGGAGDEPPMETSRGPRRRSQR